MNRTELRLGEHLIHTGRITAGDLKGCLEGRKEGAGLIDTLLRRDLVSAQELEKILSELPGDETPRDPDPLLASVRKLERYVVLTPLGRGGIGRVYLAYDTKLKRSVALKAMRVQDPGDLPRYRREVEIASSFHHPNIAAVYDAESVDDAFVIAMQYIDGKSLDQLRVSTREALETVAQAARTLQAAHDRGVIHRDLKPANLMRTEDGRLFVLDFGTARPVEASGGLTQSGTVLGTPAYMSPEQAQGLPLDPRTDVYSLGATLYSLVTQRPPFEGATLLELIRRVMFEAPLRPRQLNPLLHRDIELIVLKAMSQDRSGRYAAARDLGRDIERFLAGEPIEARPPSLFERAWRYLKRRPLALATAAAILVGLVASAAVFAIQLGRQARLSEAHGLLEQAAEKIDRWDRLMYLPPQDLRPYRALLEEAEALCARALARAGEGLARAHYQRARAAVRMGNQEAAERSIDRAIELEPSPAFVSERIRIRVRRLEGAMLDVSDLLLQGWLQAGTLPRPRLPSGLEGRFRKLFEDDFARLRGLGGEARKVQAYVAALDQAFQGRLDAAEETALSAFQALPPGERDDLSKALAMIDYLEFARQVETGGLRAADFGWAARLDQAIEHVSDAIALRECDADLYVMRGLLLSVRGLMPLSLLQTAHPPAPEADVPAQQARWRAMSKEIGPELDRIDAWMRDSLGRARQDLERARRIRPDDARAGLVMASVRVASIPLRQAVLLADEWAALEEPGKSLAFLLKAGALYKRYDQEQLLPAMQDCRAAVTLDPDHGPAWAALAWFAGAQLNNLLGLTRPQREELEAEALRASARALALGAEGRVEALVRSVRARIHLARAASGRGDRDAERRRAEEEIRRIEALDPEVAGPLRAGP